jgi:hypothetical protein
MGGVTELQAIVVELPADDAQEIGRLDCGGYGVIVSFISSKVARGNCPYVQSRSERQRDWR